MDAPMALPAMPAITRRSDGWRGPCELRWLGADDTQAIIGLQAHVAASLTMDSYYADNEEELHGLFAQGGIAAGAVADGGLIAFHTALIPGDSPCNLGSDVGLPPGELARVAHLENCAVHPDFRGNSLQRLLAAALIEALEARGYRYLCETVAPGNWPSIKSTLDNGLIITGLKKKYGGYWRYLFVRDLLHPIRPDLSAAIRWVDAADIEGQLDRFAAGHIAVRIAEEQGRMRLGFVSRLPS